MPTRRVVRGSRGPGRLWSRLRFAVDFDEVDALVVETDQVLDLRTLWDRERIAPGDIPDGSVPEREVVMDGPTLVRALGDRLRLGQQVRPHVHSGEVIAGREASLEQETWPVRIGDGLAADD